MCVAPARQVAQTMRKAASKWYAVAACCGPTHPVGVRVSAECLRSRQTGAPRRACTRRLSDGLRLANGVGLLVQAICGEFRRRPQLPPASDVRLSPPPSRRPRRPAAVSAQSRRKRGGGIANLQVGNILKLFQFSTRTPVVDAHLVNHASEGCIFQVQFSSGKNYLEATRLDNFFRRERAQPKRKAHGVLKSVAFLQESWYKKM